MAVVRTVRGDIDPADLGPTSMHEHILGTFEVWFEDVAGSPSVPGPVDSEARVDMPLLGLLRRNPFLLRDNLRLNDSANLISGQCWWTTPARYSPSPSPEAPLSRRLPGS